MLTEEVWEDTMNALQMVFSSITMTAYNEPGGKRLCYDILILHEVLISSRPGFPTVNSCTSSRPVQKNDERLVLSKLPFKLSIVMPILVPVGFVYKHGSPCFICRIKRTLRFWSGSNCVPGISFAYLYAYSKKSFGYFNYLIGYLRKYAAYLELCKSSS